VRRAGGEPFSAAADPTAGSPSARCAPLDVVAGALAQRAPADPIYILLDSPSLGVLMQKHRPLVERLGLYAMNLRLFTRPLHIFVNEAAAAATSSAPNVGVYADQEIAPLPLASLLQELLSKPVKVVPFQNVAEMARCLQQGEFEASYSKCPAKIGWAAIVEQDASLIVDVFDRQYQRLTGGQRPKPLFAEGLQLGVRTGSGGLGIEMVISPASRVRNLEGRPLAASADARIATVPRADGRPLSDQVQSQKPSTGFLATVLSGLPTFVQKLYAAPEDAVTPVDAYRYPYPVVLTNQAVPDERLRVALSDSYLRALGGTTESPCGAVAERLHRAFLFNAYLEDPSNPSKKVSLSGELVTATGGRGLGDLFSRLQLSSNPRDWPQTLGLSNPAGISCPALPNERFPEDRLFFANSNLAYQFRAKAHLDGGNLDAAGACLRRALGDSPVPTCHHAERSTYSFYYNPYFYFAVQQASSRGSAR
jgi:hypothetical protein